VRTLIEAGIDETVRAAAKVKVPEIEALRAKAGRIRATVQPLMQNHKRLTPQQKERATELLFEADECQSQADALLGELRKIADAAAAKTSLQVVVQETVYPGVTIRFPGVSTSIADMLRGPLCITTRRLHNEMRIIAQFGGSSVAHPLTTIPDADDPITAMKRLLGCPGSTVSRAAG
jgi:hypothetical protein